MTIRQVRAILNKLPDDAILVTRAGALGSSINIEKILYSPKQNLALLLLDEKVLDALALDRAMTHMDNMQGYEDE